MRINELFKKPIDRNIQGVVTIGHEKEEQIFQELDEYVCTQEIVKLFRTFFRKYRESIHTPTSKMGVWITGYFGSGKSHFLKMLGYILENKSVRGKTAPDFFEDKIGDSTIMADMKLAATSNTKVILFNIDSKAGADAKTKPQAIMDVMLRTFNEAIGLCFTSPWVADMERELIKEGAYEAFKTAFKTKSGKEWADEQNTAGRDNAFLNRDSILKALVEARHMDSDSAKKYFDDQVFNFNKSINTERFAKIVDDYCKTSKARVVFLMDEVGQFVGTDTELMLNLQTCVEDLGKFCNGKAWVVVTSQQELKAMVDASQGTRLDFSKIQGRFDSRLLLSGANADEVIKKRILDKKDEVVPTLESLYETNEARLSNLIIFDQKPTWSGYKTKDDFKNVYPFVSYQFELLQKVFEAIREHGLTEGKHLSSNERSLINAFQESALSRKDNGLETLVPFDGFFETVNNFIDYDIKRVFEQAPAKGINEFDLRVLRLLFMIKHVKEMPATTDRLATMMVSNIKEDKLALRNKIEVSLKRLEDETLVQKNGEEYDFLTNEEQDVNRQINNTAHDEGSIIRSISQIIYEVILQEQKIKYGRYEFPFNRLVDNHTIGSNNPGNLTCKVVIGLYRPIPEFELVQESMGQETIIIDLQNGNFIPELIRANKIEIYKQNHLATMSSSLASILDKKQAELSERRKRAEDGIKLAMRNAKVYSNGSALEVGTRDGKDRVFDALKKLVESKYYALGKVKSFYETVNSISDALNAADGLFEWPANDNNVEAYEEIKTKLKNDKSNGRVSTVKSLVDYFTKAPYGWKEYDIKGLIGILWKHSVVQLDSHGKSLSITSANDKYEFSRGNKADSLSIKLQEKVDDATLNEVKRIIKNVFNENIALNEEKLRVSVTDLFQKKVETLKSIQEKYGSELYPGKATIVDIYRTFTDIIRNDDAQYIFSQVIAKREFLENNADILDEILSFYQAGSAQLKNFTDANELSKWYDNNRLLENLSSVDDIMVAIGKIISDPLPFGKMVELGQLVYKARQVRDAMVKAEIGQAIESLNKDLETIRHEAKEAIAKLTDPNKVEQVNEKLSDLEVKYASLLSSVTTAKNRHQYITSSTSNVEGFKRFIQTLLIKVEPGKRTKNIQLVSLIPVANKKITSKDDVVKVVEEIKKHLLDELQGIDEINLD